jgi:thimet oligopeptidase
VAAGGVVPGWLKMDGITGLRSRTESGLLKGRFRRYVAVTMRASILMIPVCFLAACSTPEPKNPVEKRAAAANKVPHDFHPTDIAGFEKLAAKFNSAISIPTLETAPADIHRAVSNTISRAEAAFDEIAACSHEKLTFQNTIAALDDIAYDIGLAANRLNLIKETSTNAALREAATDAIKKLSEWSVGLDYREDVYRTVNAYARTLPKLVGEEDKLLREVLRDYRRAGLELPKAQRDEVERLRKELTQLTTDFESNINKTQRPVKFTKAELEGVPESFLSQPGLKTGDDEYTVLANVTFHYLTVLENAKRESTRQKLATIQNNLAREENVPLLQKILALRDRIARKLGYQSWADYVIEPKMAKTAANARGFLERLNEGLQPKFNAELAEYRALKVKETGDAGAEIRVWDWRYYSNLLKKEKYTVDAEQLRVYFPYEKTLQGMFDIYQSIFGLKFQKLEAPAKWVDDLQLFGVTDSETGEPLGLFYLDMFPREGKFNHFAQFGIIEGKRLPGGKYQRPTVALVCNFPPPTKDAPSLLSHSDVETLFHEFGHALHSILTRARFSRFAGTSVPRDFVEAPSQMLENWVWDKKVLDSFAADYRDPSKKIPKEILAKLKETKLATVATFYRRQLSFALLDLALHTEVKDGGNQDAVKISNDILSKVFLPVPEDTAFVGYFGHLMGYDAGYYGYAWADAIAADMATVFEKSPNGFYDVRTGRRLRNEIYAPGDSRDVTVSIEKFLGRKQSIQPFLKTIGIDAR